MELLRQVSNTQILFPAAAVAVVLICAALVFIFGFHSAEQPQFDKLPLVLDDKKSSSKKRKTKEKKSSPNRSANEDGKTKTESKKSPAKEKKEEKVKEEKVKPKNEVKPKKVEEKKPLKKKTVESEKPSDFDEGVWEEVPKKSEKKKVKNPEEKKEHDKKDDKKESPKNKKKESPKAKKVVEEISSEPEHEPETIKVVSAVGPDIDEEAQRALQAQVEEVQRILREAERREKEALGSYGMEDETGDAKLTDQKDLRSNKKQENKEKQKKKSEINSVKKQESVENVSENENPVEDAKNVAVFDELGDTWTDAKVAKKGKKKVRKDQ